MSDKIKLSLSDVFIGSTTGMPIGIMWTNGGEMAAQYLDISTPAAMLTAFSAGAVFGGYLGAMGFAALRHNVRVDSKPKSQEKNAAKPSIGQP